MPAKVMWRCAWTVTHPAVAGDVGGGVGGGWWVEAHGYCSGCGSGCGVDGDVCAADEGSGEHDKDEEDNGWEEDREFGGH